jgi:hypothetical protein
VFFSRTTPLAVAPAQVRGLRLSLNTPVVSTEELPIGPARAAILVHEEAGEGETVTIGMRSLRADRVVLYGLDAGASADASIDVIVDAALSFAESMGFLFDEDELGSGGAAGRTRCLGLWRELLGEAGSALAPARDRAGPAVEEADELLLEDLAEEATEVAFLPAPPEKEEPEPEIGGFIDPFEDDAGLGEPPDLGDAPGSAELDEDEAPSAPVPPLRAGPPKAPPKARAKRTEPAPAAASPAAEIAPAGSLALTKFRGPGAPGKARATPSTPPPGPAAADAASDRRPRRRKALGRLRLVRRVHDSLRKRNPILRLFGAF